MSNIDFLKELKKRIAPMQEWALEQFTKQELYEYYIDKIRSLKEENARLKEEIKCYDDRVNYLLEQIKIRDIT